jgi:hypothetical protein
MTDHINDLRPVRDDDGRILYFATFPDPACVQGTRIDYYGDGIPDPGSYWNDKRDGEWYGMTPNGHMANLAAHTVTEHEDRTITVSPSILVNRGMPGEWHGYLERGVWREC